jgi:hypothetical protein
MLYNNKIDYLKNNVQEHLLQIIHIHQAREILRSGRCGRVGEQTFVRYYWCLQLLQIRPVATWIADEQTSTTDTERTWSSTI